MMMHASPVSVSAHMILANNTLRAHHASLSEHAACRLIMIYHIFGFFLNYSIELLEIQFDGREFHSAL